MAIDFNKFGKSQAGGATSTVVTPSAPAPTPAPSGGKVDFNKFGKSSGAFTPASTIPEAPNALTQVAKTFLGAPATMVARPFQAAQSVGQFAGRDTEGLQKVSKQSHDTIRRMISTKIDKKARGEDTSQLDAAITRAMNSPNYASLELGEQAEFQPASGGLVAEAPVDAAGVKKDIGRAAQTIALGTGAPIAGGALFGAGASLEQGNDLLSVQTLVDTALGAGGGKVLQWVGKPLLNAAGKVVGTITPKILKEVAAGGASAIQKFAQENQLLGGIAAKPSAALAKGFQSVDDAIGAGTKSVTRATGAALKDQFPGLDPVAHYKAVNEKDFLRPTEVNKPAYAKATAVFNDAKNRGFELEKAANKKGIVADRLGEGGVYNTLDTAEALRDNNYRISEKIGRPAIRAAESEAGVRSIPVSQVRDEMLQRIKNIPKSQIDDADRAAFISQVEKRYAPGGPADKAHPNGYSLENLHDARIVSQKNGKYKMGQPASDALKAQRSREEGRVFAEIFDRTMPERSGMRGFRKELEQDFLLADYLESLHKKKVPKGLVGKAIGLFGRGVGGVIGGKVGGFPGFLVGSRGGEILFDTFETLPNPIKTSVLESLQMEDPKAYKDLVKYIGTAEAERLQRKLLPGKGESSFKEVPAPIFGTQGGKNTPIKQSAVDLASVESGKVNPPTTDRRLGSYLRKVEDAKSANDQYFPESVIPMGPKPKPKKSPKRLNDIY